jgi:hypothetical protein
MQTITHVSPPAHKQATCAWCYERFGTTVELLDHVDDAHLDPRMATPAERFGQHATLGQPPSAATSQSYSHDNDKQEGRP